MRLTTPSLRAHADDFLGGVVGMMSMDRSAKAACGKRRLSRWQLFERLASRDAQFGKGEDEEGQHLYAAVLGSLSLETSRRTIVQAFHATDSHFRPPLKFHSTTGCFSSQESLRRCTGGLGECLGPSDTKLEASHLGFSSSKKFQIRS